MSLCTHLEPMTFFDASSGDDVAAVDVAAVAVDGDTGWYCCCCCCLGSVASYTMAGCKGAAASFLWLDVVDVVR